MQLNLDKVQFKNNLFAAIYRYFSDRESYFRLNLVSNRV
jgi:hypothetical protein